MKNFLGTDKEISSKIQFKWEKVTLSYTLCNDMESYYTSICIKRWILCVFTGAYIKRLWNEAQETDNSDYLSEAENRMGGWRHCCFF